MKERKRERERERERIRAREEGLRAQPSPQQPHYRRRGRMLGPAFLAWARSCGMLIVNHREGDPLTRDVGTHLPKEKCLRRV